MLARDCLCISGATGKWLRCLWKSCARAREISFRSEGERRCVAKSWAETDMNGINIDALSEDELVELNHKIVARLRFLSQMRSHSEMLDFRIGEKVTFHPEIQHLGMRPHLAQKSQPDAVAFRDAGFPDWRKSDVPSFRSPRVDRNAYALQQKERHGRYRGRTTLECRARAAHQAGFAGRRQRRDCQCHCSPVLQPRTKKIKSSRAPIEI